MARYAHELASTFRFYTHCRVLGEDEALQGARLALVQNTKTVLQVVLGLLGISAPEKM